MRSKIKTAPLDKTKTIRLITCDTITEAYFIKNKLNNEGIECFLTNQNFTSLLPNYYNLFGAGVQVVVMESDYLRSRELVKDKLEPENVEKVCPYCGSTDISIGFGKHKILKIFNVLLAILIAIPIGNIRVRYYCNTCKEEIK